MGAAGWSPALARGVGAGGGERTPLGEGGRSPRPCLIYLKPR